MKVSEQQKTEWTENPVTLALKLLLIEEFDRVGKSPVTNCLIRGEPQLTQENLIEQACRELEIYSFIHALDGNWEDWELDDNESD